MGFVSRIWGSEFRAWGSLFKGLELASSGIRGGVAKESFQVEGGDGGFRISSVFVKFALSFL